MKQFYLTLLCFYFICTNAQDDKLFEYQWKLQKIVTANEIYIAEPYNPYNDPNTSVYEHIVFSEDEGYYSFIFGYYGNGMADDLSFEDSNSTMQIPYFYNHLGEYSPSEVFFSEEFVYEVISNQMTIQNPFSYSFSYEDDIIYLQITNGVGSVATFFDDFIDESEITLIPDQEFEQDLINQNIDSDGIINGQVFTDDIANISNLTLFNFLTDVTGLQDFSELKNLEIQSLYLPFQSDQVLDLTSNVMLEQLNMYGGDDGTTHIINTIDLSNNPNIYQIHTPGIWDLRQIDLKSGTTDVSNLDINISVGFPIQPDATTKAPSQNSFCIKVTDEVAATAGTGVYSTWTITAESNPYYFSETCTLSTDRFNSVEVSLYPNPVENILNIETKNIEFHSIALFNAQGQLLKKVNDLNLKKIDVSNLATGLYFLQIEGEYGVLKKKFLKL